MKRKEINRVAEKLDHYERLLKGKSLSSTLEKLKWLEEVNGDLLGVCKEGLWLLCNTCRILNPHHKDCNYCDDTKLIREVIAKVEGK